VKKQKKIKVKIKPDWKWITIIFFSTIAISATMSFLSNEILEENGLAVSLIVLLIIILIGIIFDIIGMAVTAAEEKPFHSMAARKCPEAAIAIHLLRKADRVSSFCNDVVGDICGVISGSAAAVIAVGAFSGGGDLSATMAQLGMSALVAGLTVGGKAIGKSLAMLNSTVIVHTAAKLIYWFRSVPGRIIRKKIK
jgi:CBS domain containing-hemolysin-like protein